MTSAPGGGTGTRTLPHATRTRGALGRARPPASALGLALALVAAVGAPAQASAEDGLWYYRDTGVAQAHATTTGEGVTVAVVDSQVNTEAPELAGADLVLRDESFCDVDGDGTNEPAVSDDPGAEHGTAMVSLVVGSGTGADGQPGVQGVAPGARVLHYAWDAGDVATCYAGGEGIADAIDQAVADGAQIINLSFGFGGTTASAPMLEAIARAVRAGSIVVAPAGNEAGPAREWPGLANGVVTATGVDAQQQLDSGFEVHGPGVDVAAPGVLIRELDADDGWQSYGMTRGTSTATAWTSGALALAWSAHPEATANQMIQTLLRHTTSGGGELSRVDDYWGYGIVSVGRMLDADPTSYPDVNPLVVDSADALPPAADLTQEPTAEPEDPATEPVAEEPEAPAGPPADAGEAADGGSAVVPVLVAVAVLVVAGIAATVLLTRRRGQSTVHPPHDRQER